MSTPETGPKDLNHAFDLILLGVREFGSALGAMDHGGSGQEQEEAGHSLIHSAFEHAPELNQLLPKLAAKLKAGQSVADDGYQISDEVAAAKKLLADRK